MNNYVDVANQDEFNRAVEAGDIAICAGGFFEAYGSATVRASGSATVEAYDSATVRAYGSATVRAYDSATVEAYDSATVRASGSATVRAYGSATVRAYDSATVRAYDSATVEASRRVPVHTVGDCTRVTGGIVIPEPTTLEEWLVDYGIEPDADGQVVLYKAVQADWRGSNKHAGITYEPGATPTAHDWQDTDRCGHGLHLVPLPYMGNIYCDDVAHYLACRTPLAGVRWIDQSKVKVRQLEVLHEVDIDGSSLRSSSGSQETDR